MSGIMRSPMTRLSGSLLLALVLLLVPATAVPGVPILPGVQLVPGLSLGPSSVQAADGVDVRGQTTYTIRPDDRRIDVSALITVKSVKPDTATQRFYFTAYGLGIHREATAIAATHSGVRLDIGRAERETAAGDPYTKIRVDFGRQLFYGQSFAFRLTYQLPDSGARSSSGLRVGQAYTGFYGFAYGEEEADVAIVVPSGFDVITRQGAALTEARRADGALLLQAVDIAKPADWWAYVGAERPNALRTDSFQLRIDDEEHDLLVRSWPEDRRWARVVTDRLARGLPVMGRLIGLPWPVEGRLEIIEVYSPLLGGYAGIYYESTDEIRITEAPDELIVLHEASHAWFNGDLLVGRWINEGLADEYASRTLARLGSRSYGPEPVRRDDEVAFPLNDWPAASKVEDAGTEAVETYGYNASWRVIRQLVDEVGEQGMRDVFRAAAEHQIAYLGEGPPEELEAALAKPDWRILLDLLEERAGATETDELFETWVLRPDEVPVLRAREAAREKYEQLVEDGTGWAPPLTVRRAMAAWDFELARERMDEAQAVLAQRDRVERLANAVGVQSSDGLELAYETGTADLAEASMLAEEQIETLQRLGEAAADVAAERDLFTEVGLFNETPGGVLAQARQEIEQDRYDEARQTAARAVRLLEDAPTRGTQRLLLGVGLLLTLVVGLVGLGLWWGRRRRSSLATLRATLPRQEEPPSA
jgi:hypothetical protein